MASQEVGHSTWFRSCIPIISAKMNPVAHAQASARVLKHGVVKYSSLVVGLKITCCRHSGPLSRCDSFSV